MYAENPNFDIPRKNVAQRFFEQRWSAIVIEILLTIVLTVAAGRAFDIFVPFDPSSKEQAVEMTSAISVTEPLELESPRGLLCWREAESSAGTSALGRDGGDRRILRCIWQWE